jgi:hypothetical protein
MPNILRSASALRLFCLSLFMLLAASPMWATGSSTIVISQVYGGGGSASASSAYNVDYIELLNVSGAPIDISGYSVQYGSATSHTTIAASGIFTIPAGTPALASGQYFLIAGGNSTGFGGASITNADYTPATVSLAAAAGKVFLVANGTGLTLDANGCPAAGSVIDFVGYGTAASTGANCYEGFGTGGSAAPTISNVSSVVRTGCMDTDDNGADFTLSTTPTPHNTTSPTISCGSVTPPGVFSVTSTFTPSTANTGGTTLLTATVTPATSPASTNITVTADLSAFGGSATTSLHDDGANGDVTAMDNIYSYSLAVPAGQANKAYTVNVTAKDQSNTVMSTAGVTVQTAVAPSTSIAISSSSSNPVLNTSVTFTAVITGNEPSTPTGTVTFFDGNTQLGPGVLGIPGTWTYSTSTLALGPHAITATYSGDGVYPSNTVTMPASVPVNVEPVPVTGFNFSLSNTSIVVNGDTHTGSTTMSVNFILGFNSPVTFSCSGLPAGSRCVFSPATLTASGTSTLTVGIDGASLKSTRPFGAGERTLAALGLLGLPLLLRRRKKLAGTVLGLLMLGAMAVSLSGCSGGTSTPSGTSTIMVTATSGSTTHSQAITLNVQ